MTGYTTGAGSGAAGNRLTSDGVWNYTYDNEGNLVLRARIGTSEVWSYTYDDRNHLTRVDRKTNSTTIDLTVQFTYDAWGNRIAQSVDEDGAGSGAAVVTKFLVDGWNPAKAEEKRGQASFGSSE